MNLIIHGGKDRIKTVSSCDSNFDLSGPKYSFFTGNIGKRERLGQSLRFSCDLACAGIIPPVSRTFNQISREASRERRRRRRGLREGEG